ncbi:hypothetical protein NW759_015622 [Fusarium solani]|nr:hypothetical protein NW759_015622 [Fusarium solani]
MTNSTKTGDEASGAKRASDFNDSLQNVPAFEAMMSTLRLGQRAQSQLRKCEYDEYLKLSQQAGMLLHASTDQKQPTPGWCPEAEEIQQQVNERFKDYPEVAQNFRAFVQNGHVAITQSRATGKK